MSEHFAVIGLTSWGATLASLLARNGHRTTLIARSAEEAERVRTAGHLPRVDGLPLGASLDVRAPGELPATVAGVIVAVPAQAVRATLTGLPLPPVPVLSAAKGIELATGQRMSEVLVSCGCSPSRVSAISGPNLAAEILAGLPAAAVVAASDEREAGRWQAVLASPLFRVYRTPDLAGVELAGALKNVVAIAAGAAVGFGFGANTVASLMTRGLAEITRLGVALGANPLTFQGLAGVGDLAATCFSDLSRNRRLGEALARGMPVASALASVGGVAEGAPTAAVACRFAAANGVELPIATQVAAVLAGETDVRAAMSALLARPLAAEEPGR